ncbi:POTRA domain-containing protein [Parasediminibacterium paludis]|uniref:POTRA domain-containing protein n=1 Tax=Parasediminibacterium paludis TaxID=908966 RepID=A0ABV8PZM8_9BACT
MRCSFLLLLIIVFGGSLQAQQDSLTIHKLADTTIITSNQYVTVSNIVIKGNKRTKAYIILREMVLHQGDTILLKDLNKKLEQSRNQVYNTALFVDATISAGQQIGNSITVEVDVKERWYFFPLLYFRLVDRNFNQWLVDQKASLDRVNYGIKFTQGNLTGQNDELAIWLITGYSQQISLRYSLPFFDKKRQQGFSVGFGHSEQKEFNYNTSLNKQLFYKAEDYTRTVTRADLSYTYRPDQYWRHSLQAVFMYEGISDSALIVNPNYFPENRKEVQYLTLNYGVSYAKTDYNAYPTSGIIAGAYVSKRGFDETTSLWQIGGRVLYAFPLSSRSFVHLEGAATVKFTKDKEFYFNQRLFGYGDLQMRGLEYYVIDGTAGLLGKATIHKQVFKYVFKNPFKSKTHDLIPFRFFLKAFGDMGYAYNKYPDNSLLNNKLIYSGGVGLDIVSIYDFVFKIELSFNQLGSEGLYLHGGRD